MSHSRESAAPSPSDMVELALSSAEAGIELVAIAEEEHRGNLRWAQNGLTTNGLTRTSSLTLAAIVSGHEGARTATLTRTGVQSPAIKDLVEEVSAAAHASSPNPNESDTHLIAGESDANFEQGSPGLTPDVFTPLVDPLARALASAARDDVTWSGYAEATLDSTWLGTTSGTRLSHHQPAGRIEITARSRRLDGQVASTWAGSACESFDQVSVESMADELARGRRWAQSDVDVQPGRHTVILTASAVADLVIPALWSASARDAAEGRSAFGDGRSGARIGQQLMGDGVDITSDPHHRLIPTRPFVVEHASGPTASLLDNGVALSQTRWIEDGVLRHLMGPRSLGSTIAATRQAIDNVVIAAPGRGSLDELIARTEKALLITCFWYIRDVDPQTLLLTGLTRDGVYQVRDGEVVGAAPNFRFNVSPLDVMSSIVDGTDAHRTQPREWGDYVHRVVSPALRVEGFNLSTRSDAR